jgi:hypothetical protein
MSRGILYICADDEYLNEARSSARSAADQMDDTPIAIITDADSPGDVFDIVIQRDDLQSSVVDKSDHIHRTPFERTLYIDTDTYVAAPVHDIFDVLDHADIATALAANRHYDIGLPQAVPHRQGGVIAFRDNDAVQNAFKRWREIYADQRDQGQISDQPPLTKALTGCDATVQTLSVEDNCLVYYGERVQGAVRIVHGHKDLKRRAEKLNKITRRRVFTSILDSEVVFVDQESLTRPEMVYWSVRSDGVLATVQRIKHQILS